LDIFRIFSKAITDESLVWHSLLDRWALANYPWIFDFLWNGWLLWYFLFCKMEYWSQCFPLNFFLPVVCFFTNPNNFFNAAAFCCQPICK
jgi:hypothetical protein